MAQSEPKRRAGHQRRKPNLAVLEARIRAGLSREGLGDLAGITGKQVGLIERGVAQRSRPETVVAISRALKEEDVFVLFPDRRRL